MRKRLMPIFAFCLAVMSLAPQSVNAQKSADTLRIVFRDGVPNVDPYMNNLRTGVVLGHQGWDMLVHRDPATFELRPLLATEWRTVDDKTIDFTLRAGVKFHDGSPLTADDVVYTLNFAANPESKVATPANYNWIDHAEKTGELSVRLHLKRPTPAALQYLGFVGYILPKAYREKVGLDGYAKAPVGSGPYRIVKVEPGKSVEFERFEDYWENSPKGRPAIKRLSVRFVPDAATEMTELLAGRADWIWNINPDQFDQVGKMPTLQSLRKETMRVGFLQLDAAGRSGAGNPLTNVKVRQAIWHAIDRQAIADKLVTGGSRVPLGPCYPGQFGCETDAAMKYEYNPEKAKKLLAEAGFPNGFETEMVTYVLPTWAAAVQNYLAAVGIKARISQLQVSAVIQRAWKGENPMTLGSWGSYSINDVSAIMPNYFNGGQDDYARDAELTELIARGGESDDPVVRKKLYALAIKRVTEQAYWLPLHTYVTTYGFSRDLDFTPWADELPRFFWTKWK
jgi:peptide/nickel transport system substrate-binding protein